MPASVLLPFVIFWSTLDRSLILPLVPAIAGELGVSVATTTVAITTHAFAYAALQVLWGPLSTRWGRIRVLWVSTAIASLACAVAAIAPDMTTFLVARTVSGGAFAATFAAVLTYFGDTLPLARRPAAMSNLATATALALASGTIVAGAAVEVVSWRWVFGVFAVVTACLVPLIARLRDVRDAGGATLRMQVNTLLRSRWALAVCALVAVEGILLIGVFNLLPAVLQESGTGAFVAGAVTAAFGAAVIVVSQLMKLWVARVAPAVFLGVGGGLAASAMVVLATGVGPVTVLVAAILMGMAWALAHTTLQTWMTDAASASRTLGMTLFSISLMLGASAGSGVGAIAVAHDAFGVLAAGSAAVAVVFTVAVVVLRTRYREREQESSARS